MMKRVLIEANHAPNPFSQQSCLAWSFPVFKGHTSSEGRQRIVGVTDKDAARAQLTSAKGKLVSAQAMEEFASLRSPVDGVVTDRPLFPGETATAGTNVITVMDTSSLLAKVHLAQAVPQKLTVGHKAKITVPGMDALVEASVSLKRPALDPGSTTVEVWLKLPNKQGLLKVGTPVHAVILGATIKEAMQVPTSTIVPSRDGGTSVMVIAAEARRTRGR